MSLTRSDSRLHAIYEALPPAHRCAIDDAFTAAKDAIVMSDVDHLTWARDDRAEVLVAAITRYLVESNPNDAAIKAAIEEVDQ